MSYKSGGPAFPRPISTDDHEHSCNISYDQTGMTLRDWFAGQALVGFLGADPEYPPEVDPHKRPVIAAITCYLLADAMIAERMIAEREKGE